MTGNLIQGKEATIVIFDKPLTSNALFIENFAWKTLIRGKIVYEQGEL